MNKRRGDRLIPEGPLMSPSSSTVLVVEDDEIIRDITTLILEQEGYRVLQARDGKHALEVLAATPRPPDVAVIDWNMPVMSGAELLLAMQAHPGLRGIPVLICTANPLTLDILQGGVPVLCVFKPTSPAELASAVETTLRSASRAEVTRRAGI